MALLSLTPAAVAHAAPAVASTAQEVLQAQAPALADTLPPGQLPDRVTDASGVLDPEQNAQLGAALQQFLTDHQKSIFLVYFPSFGDYTPMEWAEAAAAANGGGNTLVLAVATEDRQYGLAADTSAGYWAEWELDDVEDAIFPSLVDSDWAGVGFAAVEDATASARMNEAVDDVVGGIASFFGLDDDAEPEPPAQAEPEKVEETAAAVPEEDPPYVTDLSGVLDPAQAAEMEDAIDELAEEAGRNLFVVYVPTAEYDLSEWSAQVSDEADEATLTAMFFTDDVAHSVGPLSETGYWDQEQLDYLQAATRTGLEESGWAGGGFAAIEAAFSTEISAAGVDPAAVAAEPAQVSPTRPAYEVSPSRPARNDGAGTGWLLLAMLVIAAVGALAIVRYVAQKKAAKKMATARSISPADPSELSLLATTTLRRRAEEITVAIRASVLRGQEAFDNAHSEFGIGRTRAFTRALDNADHVLQHTQREREELFLVVPTVQAENSTGFSRTLKKLGYSLKRRWFHSVKSQSGSDVEQEPRTRIRLINLISAYGLAQEELDEQISAFADRRELLLHAHAHLDELTRATVALRTRLKRMSVVFSDLEARYGPALFSSISENVGKATESLDHAERQLQIGYELKAKPAGEQGRLSYIIRDTTRAVELTDDLLLRIRNAEDDLTIAQEGLPPLIKETTEEIKEAAQLKKRGASLYLPADWDALDTAAAEASIVLAEAETRGATAPLGSYVALLEADTALEEQLRAAHTVIDAQKRQLTRLNKYLLPAQEQIQVADNLIVTHQEIVNTETRASLLNARRLVERATQLREAAAPLWQAIEYATPSTQHAKQAAEQAQKDITAHQEKVEAEQEAARTAARREARMATLREARRAAQERENENKAARKATNRAARWAAAIAASSSSTSSHSSWSSSSSGNSSSSSSRRSSSSSSRSSSSRRSSSRGGSFGGGSSTRSNRGSRGGGFSSRGGSF